MKEFIDALSDVDAAEVIAAMAEVRRDGLRCARHLEGDIYEVRADGEDQTFRILFATEGAHSEVLLSLMASRRRRRRLRLRRSDWRSGGSPIGVAGRAPELSGYLKIAISIVRWDTGLVSGDDFLSELIDERSSTNPVFPALVDAALRRRTLVRDLVAQREAAGLSQTVVAARMGTSQSAVARLEASGTDARLSTLERYAAALGQRLEWQVVKDVPTSQPTRKPRRRPVTA